MEITYIRYNKKNIHFFNKKCINLKNLDIYPYENKGNKYNVYTIFT
jgi:hypothetical protein